MSDESSNEKKMSAEALNAQQEQQGKKVWPKDEGESLDAEQTAAEADGAVANEALAYPNHAELEQKLTEAEQKAHEYWNQLTRTKAEMENIQRRCERDVANAHKFGIEKFAVDLLNVMDSLERGLQGKDDILGDTLALRVYEGLELTRDQMMSTLEKFGVVQLLPKGEVFDPSKHEAISMIESDADANTVVEVMQPGYTLNERLIRPAMVVVAK